MGPGAADAARAEAERAGIDLDDVVDVVAHRVTPVPGEAGVLESVDDRYRAVFDGSGFALDDFKVSLTTVRRGDTAVPLAAGAVAGGGQRRVPADQRRGDRAGHRPGRRAGMGRGPRPSAPG